MKCTECSSDRLVNLPYNKVIHLCIDCRCILSNDSGELRRDFFYEEDWKKMASHVNRTYDQVFNDELAFAKSKLTASV